MSKLLTKLWSDESGQGMAEYGLILALVAVIAIAAFKTLGDGVSTQVSKVGTEIQNAGTTTTP